MYLRYTDTSPEGLERTKLIKNLLPKESLVQQFLAPKVNAMYPTLLKMLYAELEIYRAYPKKPLEESGKAKAAVKTFEPRNHTTCFQGKAFKVKDKTFGDADLRDYRRAIGTFNHAEWGDSTLMEIWAGDHMKDHPKMVTNAFKYGANLIKTRPVLKFNINPLFMNRTSGKTILTPEQEVYNYDQDLLLAKAMMWGARTAAESNRALDSRSARSAKVEKREHEKYLERRKKDIGH
jgi:hypothetical protein